MFCFKCGENLPNDAQFCNNCGSNLSAIQPEPQQPQVQAPPQPQVQPQSQPKVQSTVAPNNNKILIGIIIALCLFIIICYFVVSSSEDDTPKVTDVTTQSSESESNVNTNLNNEAHEAYHEYLDYLRENYANDDFDLYGFPGVLGLYSSNRNIDDLTYAILDIDKDGIDELLIGETGNSDPGYFHGLFAFIDGEVTSIVNSEDGYYLYLMNDFSFYWRYKSRGITKHKFENNEFIELEYYTRELVDENNPNEYSWFEVLKKDGKYDRENLRQFTQEDPDLFGILDNEQYEIDYIPLAQEVVNSSNSSTTSAVTLDLNSVINLDAVADFSGSGNINNYQEGMERPDPSNPTAGKAFDIIDADLYALSDYGGGNFSYWVVGDNVFVSFPYCSYAFCLNISGASLNNGDNLVLYGDEYVVDVVARTEEARLRLLGYKSSTGLLTNSDSYSLLENWCSTQAVSIYPEVTWVYADEVNNGNGYSPAYVLNTYLWKGNQMIGEFPVYVDRLYGVISIDDYGTLYSANDWYNFYVR